MLSIEQRLSLLDLAARTIDSHGHYSNILKAAQEYEAFALGRYSKAEEPAPAPVEKETFKSFLKTTTVAHPLKGLIPFRAYDFQNDLADDIENSPKIMIKHARQMGISTLLVAYAWYFASRNLDQTVVLATGRKIMAAALKARMVENLPEAERGVLEHENMYSVRLNNGSLIKFVSTADACRGFGINLLIFDAMAYVRPDLLTALMPYVSMTSCRVIMASDPGPGMNPFQKMYQNDDVDAYRRFAVPYYLHPDRDEEWADMMKRQIGEASFRTENGVEDKWRPWSLS